MAASSMGDARPEDAAAIAAAHRATFPTLSEAVLVESLHAAGAATVSRVARHEGRVVGHVLLSPVRLQWDGMEAPAATTATHSPAWLGLAPLGVLPRLQRRGLGSALVWDALAQARERGCEVVVLLGDPAYYARFGFGPARDFGLRCRWPGAESAFMLRELRPGSVAAAATAARGAGTAATAAAGANASAGRGAGACTGLVHYHPAFDVLE